jgi:hypothetical protein
MSEETLRDHEAVALVRQMRGSSFGWAKARIEEAIASGEVQWHDGAVEDFSVRPHTIRKIKHLNKNDLLFWLNQKWPPTPSANPPQPAPQPPASGRPKKKVVQDAAEKRLLSLFPESGGVPSADLRPKDILSLVNEGLSPKARFLRDTTSRAVKNLKKKAEQNQ